MQETQETWVRSLNWEDPLEQEMAICYSIFSWEIPRTEEPGELQCVRSQRVGHDLATKPPALRKCYSLRVGVNQS